MQTNTCNNSLGGSDIDQALFASNSSSSWQGRRRSRYWNMSTCKSKLGYVCIGIHLSLYSESCDIPAFSVCRVGDCFYVSPDTFDQIEDPDALKPEVPAYLAKSRFHKGGANAGLRAFGVAKLLAVQKADGQASVSKTMNLPPLEVFAECVLAAAVSCEGLLSQMQQKNKP